MKKLLVPFNLLASLILVRFTVSKFAAWPISVAAFEDMAKPLGIDPTFFRISTGFIIGLASLSLLVTSIIVLFNLDKHKRGVLVIAFNSFYALGAMVGALFSEFFLRSSVKWSLVYIALAIIAVLIANLLAFRQQIIAALPSQTRAQAQRPGLAQTTDPAPVG